MNYDIDINNIVINNPGEPCKVPDPDLNPKLEK